jgi:hypothetical protein
MGGESIPLMGIAASFSLWVEEEEIHFGINRATDPYRSAKWHLHSTGPYRHEDKAWILESTEDPETSDVRADPGVRYNTMGTGVVGKLMISNIIYFGRSG